MLSKKLYDRWTVIAKFAHFESEGDPYIGAAVPPDTSRFSLEVNFVYCEKYFFLQKMSRVWADGGLSPYEDGVCYQEDPSKRERRQ